MELENLTEAPLVLNWRECAIVDSAGWTYSIAHPELAEEALTQADVVVLIAPYAKRRIPIVPRAAFRLQTALPAGVAPARPRRDNWPTAGLTERIILNLSYRGETLYYDLSMRYVPLSDEALVRD